MCRRMVIANLPDFAFVSARRSMIGSGHTQASGFWSEALSLQFRESDSPVSIFECVSGIPLTTESYV